LGSRQVVTEVGRQARGQANGQVGSQIGQQAGERVNSIRTGRAGEWEVNGLGR
jgi:hypothetical protein